MDRLEEHIKKNRVDLDIYDPSPMLWNEISKSIKGKRSARIKWLSAAAMIIVIFTTAALFYVGESRKKMALLSKNSEVLIMEANLQLQETETYYNNQVNYLYSEAKPLLAGHPDINKELLSDMSQIDSLCAEIKNDLKDNIANQEVIEALINNYRIKIKILKDMLDLLKQDENEPQKNINHAL
jgi:hypothetical protein